MYEIVIRFIEIFYVIAWTISWTIYNDAFVT